MITVVNPAQATKPDGRSPCSSEIHSALLCEQGSHLYLDRCITVAMRTNSLRSFLRFDFLLLRVISKISERVKGLI